MKKISTIATEENEESPKEVIIGTQIWMAENLNVDKFCNGDLIPEAETDEEWEWAFLNKQPAWCYYESGPWWGYHDNEPANRPKYGKLYNWYAVNNSRGLAPSGYHIPTDEDWTTLVNYLGERNAGYKMKSTIRWIKNGNGDNSSGFSGLPGGYRGDAGSFLCIEEFGHWWSSTEYDTYDAWSRDLGYDDGLVFRGLYSKGSGLSVRCLRD
jgi:uncharacterized protein (TIGR02145 family)